MDEYVIVGPVFGLMAFILAISAISKATKLEKELNELKRTVEKLQAGK